MPNSALCLYNLCQSGKVSLQPCHTQLVTSYAWFARKPLFTDQAASFRSYLKVDHSQFCHLGRAAVTSKLKHIFHCYSHGYICKGIL